MKKPQLLEIYDHEMHWFRPSWKARIELFKRNFLKIFLTVKKIIGKLLWYSALPLLILAIYAMIWSSKQHAIQSIEKYQKMTLTEQLDYYQEMAKKAKNAKH